MLSIVKVSMVREAAPPEWGNCLTDPEGAAGVVRAFLGHPDRECFGILFLDARHRVTGIHLVSMGSLADSLVHPREVFTAAILSKSHALILFHNHPSGDLATSMADISITERLCKAGEILGIEVIDHLVVTEDSHVSFKQAGRMP